MAENDEKIKVELELPKDEVLARVARQAQEEARKSEPGPQKGEDQVEPMSIREAIAKELDPTTEGPISQTTGYKLGEIITAPLHPPEPEVKQKPVYGQVRSLIIGFALIPLALIAWLIFGSSVGISIALIGAALIALGVLVRI